MENDRARLDPTFSIYLDLARFMAAFLVLLTHYLQYGLVGGWMARLLPSAGRESVIVFFVLSGFVIAYSTLSKQVSPRDYFAARLTRICSVAVPVVLLAFACAMLVTRLYGPGLAPDYVLQKAYVYLPLHLLFMGDLWSISEEPPWLSPYWSLGYEVWYYVLFGVLCYLRGWRLALATALTLAVMGYKLWLLLPVWAAGVWLYKWLERHTVSRPAARIGWLASTLLLIAYNLSGLEITLRAAAVSLWPFPHLPLGSAERVLADYVVGILVVANFACARYAGFALLERFAGPIRRLSFFTFPLYLAHALVLGIWRAFHPHQTGAGALDILVVTLIVAAFTWVLGHGAERLRLRTLAWIAGWPTPRRFSRADFSDPLAPTDADKLRATLQPLKRKH
jgi:peptidoglycan/LPS O-acetylase OafA/YrhL